MEKYITIIRLSSRGQVAIPKEIRKKLQWETGDYVTVEIQEEVVITRCLKRDKVLSYSTK